MKMPGEGMPLHQKSGEYGDLFVNFKVKFPTELDSKQRESKSLITLNLVANKLFSRRSNW